MASTRLLTRATLVEGECCHYCATLLCRMMLESKYSQIPVNTDTEWAIQSVRIKRVGFKETAWTKQTVRILRGVRIKRISVRRGLTVSSFASIFFRFVFLQIPSIAASSSSSSIERFVTFISYRPLPLRCLVSLAI